MIEFPSNDAIIEAAKEHKINTFVADDPSERLERLPLDTETALFRIVQASLTNIHRHSGSETARRGIANASLTHILSSGSVVGVGIAGMSERIEQLGGRLNITSNTQGTTVHAVLPLGKEAN